MNSNKTRILVIEDDEDDFIIVRDIISDIKHHDYSVEWAPSYADGIKIIAEKRHDVYLVDYHLGAHTGLELVKEAVRNRCTEPLIILTGEQDIALDQQAMEAGVSDYLIKGKISSRSLESAIRYSIAQAKHIREINEIKDQLEQRVKERTLILEETIIDLNATKEELNTALQKEKELNDLKTRFVSMASHEFRTPLAAILSSLSLVKKYGELNDKENHTRHIDRIKSSVNNLTDIINDMLSISKLEEGKSSVSNEKFDISDLISEVVREMRTIAKPRQELIYSHTGKKEIILDQKILKHILLNLTSNAIKFSPDGKKIEITSEISGNEIKITLKDQGIGIPEEDQKYLFERFFRGKNATNIQGTGLGLNIVAKYAEMLNGTIHCSSVLGEGTTFTLRFPDKFFVS
ncbi:MAG TPA: hybrid sensor histidine kinase/response regulator [Bacteroidia bacterium]|nr:hybrid sensor histidine kinase/response regulator [Bacteroidia bacterium]